MTITLSAETQKLIEQRMKETRARMRRRCNQIALRSFDQLRGEDFEDLDPEVRSAIDEGEANYQEGGLPVA